MVDLNGEFKRIWYIVVLVIVLAKSAVNAQDPPDLRELIFLDKRMNRVSFTDGDGFVKIVCLELNNQCDKMELVNAESKKINDTNCENRYATFILQVSETPFGEYKCAYKGQESNPIKLLYHSCGKNDDKTCDNGQFCIVTKGTDGRKQSQCGNVGLLEKCADQHMKIGTELRVKVCPSGTGLVSMCHAIASSQLESVQVEQTEACGSAHPRMTYGGDGVNQNTVTEIKPNQNIDVLCLDRNSRDSNINCTLTGPDGEPMKFGKVPQSTCPGMATFKLPNDVFSRSGIYQMACSLNQGSYWAFMNARFLSFADDIKATIDDKAICGISNIPSDLQSECHVIGPNGKKIQESNVPGERHCECKIFYLHKAPWKRFDGKTIKSEKIKITSPPSSSTNPTSGRTNDPRVTTTSSAKPASGQTDEPSATTTSSPKTKTYSLFGIEMSYGLFVGVIAGVVVGALIIVAVIVIAVVCCVMKKKAEKAPPVQKAEISVEKAPKAENNVKKKDPLEGYTPVAKADNNRQPTEEQVKAIKIWGYRPSWTVAYLVNALDEANKRRRDPKELLRTSELLDEHAQWEKCKLEKIFGSANKGELEKVLLDTKVHCTHGNKMSGFYKDNNIIIAECPLKIAEMDFDVQGLGNVEKVGVFFLIGRKIKRYWAGSKIHLGLASQRLIQPTNPAEKPFGVEVVTASVALSDPGDEREIRIINVPYERGDPDFPKAMAVGLDQALPQQADQAGLGFPNIAFMDTQGGFDEAVIAGVCFPLLQAYLQFRKFPLTFVIDNVRKARYGALSPKLLGTSKVAEQVIAIFEVMHALMVIHGSAEKIGAAAQSLVALSSVEQSRKQQSVMEKSRAGQSPHGAQSMTKQSMNGGPRTKQSATGDQRRTPTSTPRGGRSHEDRGRESKDKGRSPDRGRDRGGRPESRDRGGGGRRR